MSSDAADSETKAGTDVSDDMTLLGSMKISEWPSSAVDKPKRKLPKHMRDLLEPGAEYTPWGDIIFELQGQDADGTLLPDFPLEKYKQMSPEWLNRFAQIPTPIRLDRINRGAHFKWKWPLTHEERIKELEAVLLDERWERQVNDIKAVIEYHKEFDGNALCESDMINFHNGRRLEEGEYPPGQPGWVEGCASMCMNAPPQQIRAIFQVLPVNHRGQLDDGLIGPTSYASFAYNSSMQNARGR